MVFGGPGGGFGGFQVGSKSSGKPLLRLPRRKPPKPPPGPPKPKITLQQGKILFYDFKIKMNRNHKIVFLLVVGLFLVLVVLVVVLVAFRLVVKVVASHYCYRC